MWHVLMTFWLRCEEIPKGYVLRTYAKSVIIVSGFHDSRVRVIASTRPLGRAIRA